MCAVTRIISNVLCHAGRSKSDANVRHHSPFDGVYIAGTDVCHKLVGLV